MEPIESREILIPTGIRETKSQDGAVLLDIEQGVCFSLNPIGLKIWEMLKEGQSIDQVADTLSNEFPVSKQQVLSDIQEFVTALEAKHLIRRPGQRESRKSWFARLLQFSRRQERLQLK